MTIDIPYFMTNEAWYTIGDDGYELTPEAPQEAIESYKTFYEEVNKLNVLVEQE